VIKKLLITNRGEIARRIMRTARSMGIFCVVIYEDEDATSPYVEEADAAFHLPKGFLDQETILKICADEKIDAIHPGYGFLSENAEFVRRVEQAKIIFVGPPASAMERMGEKTAARIEAKTAKVPLLEGEEIGDATKLSAADRSRLVQKIGLPVVLKAAAGGGGKAQAIIESESEIDAAFDKVIREAERLYGSKSLVAERYLARARHVEVQILGNALGENYSLFDRDCSAQRNNQKVIEEAPAPNLPDAVRKELHASATRLANHVGYKNAGTMEYLFDPTTSEFYFLEMNTRLQVEHTVTEMITGLDLVREQILIAQGSSASYANVQISGCALQARVCAEKSDGTYLPSTGKITDYEEPSGVRIDSGVRTGSLISGKYDNMIAKVIVHRSTRDEAIEVLIAKLGALIINGIHTNIPLVVKLLKDPNFTAVNHYTRYLQREFVPPKSDADLAAITAAILLYTFEKAESQKLYGDLAGFTNSR